MYAGCMPHMNLVNGHTLDEFFVAQWIKCYLASRATLPSFYRGQEKVFSHR